MRNAPPGKTVASREKQLVSLAVDLAEQQLREGTASPSVITHYLKLGTTSYELEREKLQRETELLRAKTENLKSMSRLEEMYKEGMQALWRYSGNEDESGYD